MLKWPAFLTASILLDVYYYLSILVVFVPNKDAIYLAKSGRDTVDELASNLVNYIRTVIQVITGYWMFIFVSVIRSDAYIKENVL